MGYLALQERHFLDARSRFTSAIADIESQRIRILSAETRSFLVARYRASAYAGLVEAFFGLNDSPAAFSTSERARARSLLDLLTEARLDVRRGVEPALLNVNAICRNHSTPKPNAKHAC